MSTSQQAAPVALPTTRNNVRNAQQQDLEQTNTAPPAGSTWRSDGYDRPANGVPSTRMDSRRAGTGHGRTQSRYTEQPTPAPAPVPITNGTSTTEQSRSTSTSHPPQNLRKRTTIDATTGHWELGKTIGAGSMGKVKLARNKETGEQVAVKIVPRHSTDGEHRTEAERQRADQSKETRTAREAAIVTLADHPYICGMRDVMRTNYHWYMLFEYVNGGQMLDYIISHGRLKEKQARKFGRQIASALDYCHRNSIVHRDLKIENILISKTGDIKIIDFGLSNLFSPRGHLKTFCGSLYFAAPELLQAKQYTGPEVDVWSFGIVLYVLVCGKVPFDDQSMPQLHAKIKKGYVEYPPWLTPECRNLIARMLTTNPAERASLQEIMNHPWMTKGFNGPPDNYVPGRRPLQLPLDPLVIDKMTGFDFGSPDVIMSHLTRTIESEEYQRAARSAEKRNASQQQPDSERRRGVFDFYKRRNSISSRDTLNTPSSEAVQLGRDPNNAFDPLISIYFLAQEKLEREARERNPGGLSMPQEPGEKPLKVPNMPSAPEAAYTNSHTAEMAGENPTGGRSRPRARTHGEDEIAEGLQTLNVTTAPNPTIMEPEQQVQQRKESTAAGLLRRLSTRRHKEPAERERPRTERPAHPPSSLEKYGTSEVTARSLSVKRTRESESQSRPESSQEAKAGELLEPGDGAGDAMTREKPSKRSYGLGRSISVNSSDMRRRLTRRGVSEGSSMRPAMASSGTQEQRQSMEQSRREEAAASDVEASTRSQSGISGRARSMGHSRRESMQARRIKRDATRTSDVPEETDAEMQDGNDVVGNEGGGSISGMKPVYLKGLFSVSTTSNRPLPVIRADIIRVLNQLGVEYREIKGGFTCKHAPSIRPNNAQAVDERAVSPSTGAAPIGPPNGPSHQRKISFGRLKSADRDEVRNSPPANTRAIPHKPGRAPILQHFRCIRF